MCIEDKDGGIVITADAATFELVKRAATLLYTNYRTTKVKPKLLSVKTIMGKMLFNTQSESTHPGARAIMLICIQQQVG